MKRIFASPVLFFALLILNVAIQPTHCAAQSLHLPLGLGPGDEYRLAFVTSGTRDATSSNIADYNAFVRDEANAPGSIVSGLQTDWFAIASTEDDDAVENTGTDPSPAGDTGVPTYLVDGQTRVADHYDDLWEGDFVFLVSPLHLTQSGNPPVDTHNNVWTGTDYFGVAGGIGGPLGSPFPSLGASISPNGRWINNNFSASNSESKSLYAISSVLVAVPEPCGLMLVMLGAILVTANLRRSS